MHSNHSLGGLHGERRNGGDSVTVERGKSFQVRSDAGSAGRIESRDRQKNRRCAARLITQFSLPPRQARKLKYASAAGKLKCTRIVTAGARPILQKWSRPEIN